MVDGPSTMVDASPDELTGRIGQAIRARRTARGMSLGDLSRATGLSKTILARIERGEGNPSVETLWRLSRGLEVPLGALLAEEPPERVRIIRAGAGEAMRGDSGMVGRLLHAEGREHRAEVYELDFPAGADHAGEPHLPGTEELVVCVRGRLEVGPAGEEVALRAGDAAWFVADGPHRYHAPVAARALGWVLYPR